VIVKRDKKMEQANAKKSPIYFNMNAPDWYMNIQSVDEKCRIIEDLAAELKDEPSINEEQLKELIDVE